MAPREARMINAMLADYKLRDGLAEFIPDWLPAANPSSFPSLDLSLPGT